MQISFFIPLIITILIEFLIYLVFVKKRMWNLLAFSILINAFTNPLANLIYGFWSNLIVIELLVFLIEIPLIKILLKQRWRKAILFSLIANFASFIFGILLSV